MESEDGYSDALPPWQTQELRAGFPSPATAALLAVALKTQPSSFLKPLVRPDRVPSLFGERVVSSVASLGPAVQAARIWWVKILCTWQSVWGGARRMYKLQALVKDWRKFSPN